MKWITLRPFGFSYFEIYIGPSSFATGTISKAKGAPEYSCFWSNGTVTVATTRGSFLSARAWVEKQAA